MAVNLPLVPGSSTITTLLGKFNDDDPDFRFMALNDLITVFDTAKPDILLHEYNIAARTIDAVVKALDDQNGEVQNQAIRWSVLYPSDLSPVLSSCITLTHCSIPQSHAAGGKNPDQPYWAVDREGHDDEIGQLGRYLNSRSRY